VIAAVVFDLDGVLIDSEGAWTSARQQVARERGGTWRDDSTRVMMGMSAPEWSRYMHSELHVDMPPAQIEAEVVGRLERLYRRNLPLLAGARDAVETLSRRWPLGLASSANRPVIELVLALADLRSRFAVVLSAEEVARGKPAPDVYLEAARGLDAEPTRCAAVEDSTNGLRAAAAAEMRVIAVPNREFPPTADALRLADATIASLEELRPALVDRLGASER
jgi:HAD superfamily hydrolase (TIGR01509 family)